MSIASHRLDLPVTENLAFGNFLFLLMFVGLGWLCLGVLAHMHRGSKRAWRLLAVVVGMGCFAAQGGIRWWVGGSAPTTDLLMLALFGLVVAVVSVRFFPEAWLRLLLGWERRREGR